MEPTVEQNENERDGTEPKREAVVLEGDSSDAFGSGQDADQHERQRTGTANRSAARLKMMLSASSTPNVVRSSAVASGSVPVICSSRLLARCARARTRGKQSSSASTSSLAACERADYSESECTRRRR